MHTRLNTAGRHVALLAYRLVLQVLFAPLLLLPCGVVIAQTAPKAAPDKVVDLEWLELLPENERDKGVAAPPPPGHNFLDDGGGAAMAQEMSFAINPAVNGMLVRMPGFVVPLDHDEKGLVTEFFLVPYYGACIHYPPPPPNQVVYVVPPKPFKLPTLASPYWVTGKMQTSGKTSRVGVSAYTVTAQSMEPYKGP